MSNITIFTHNILETGTLTVSGVADSGYPNQRLHDREISLYWKDVSESVINFNVNQGASPKAVDILIIEGHNFSGEEIAWQWSDDNAAWYNAVPVWTQSDNTKIVKTLDTPLTKQYWRLLIGNVVITTTTTTTASTTVSTTSSSSTTTTTA